MTRRMSLVAFLMGVALLGPFGAASAQEQRSTDTFAWVRANESDVIQGEEVTFNGAVQSSDANCYSQVTVTLRSDASDDMVSSPEQSPVVDTVETDAEGRFSVVTNVTAGGQFLVTVDQPTDGCTTAVSDEVGVRVRTRIDLSKAPRLRRDDANVVRLNAMVRSDCNSVRKDRDSGDPYGALYLEKLTAKGWKRLTSEWDVKKGCTFTFKREVRRRTAFRVVGEGYFVGTTGYDFSVRGSTSEELFIR